jgi:hypothetical protein
MIDAAARDMLRTLGNDAFQAAERSSEPARDYARLRLRADDLNRRHTLMCREDFDSLLPSPNALLEIDALHRAFGQAFDDAPSRAPAVHPDTFRALLRSLAGWAAGIDAAYQTLRRRPTNVTSSAARRPRGGEPP